ncbi:hypothetical protein [Flammeovirga sp. SJP92]|uniref:hypothetical protein n=1 Tax=Flammeovirga sp. SJP92 TaxID=1775430 RepID=UPI00078877BF|nr:hypothetical protein [Flammeovirga sp. SJP92]KXX67195.1 hypothetical protein AVL50_27800 [Flammeovirga sp. SJP92]
MNAIAEFFYIGGIEAMTTISISGIVMIALLVVRIFNINSRKFTPEKSLSVAGELATFSLVLGVFFQLIGLYSAFVHIEAVGSVSMGMLAGGLKVSSHATLYGFFYFLIGKLTIIIIRLNEK